MSIDIINNEKFIQANETFSALTRVNKEIGKGDTRSYPPIDDSDLKKITDYFKESRQGPPDARKLQEVLICYVLLYVCQRGRENL